MKFNLNRKEALTAVCKTALAVCEKSSLMELTGIQIEASEDTGKVSFLGTDLVIAIRCEMQADVEVGGKIIVNAQLLTGMLNRFDAESVTIELTSNNLLWLKAGNAQYTVATLPPDVLANLEIPAPETVVRLNNLHSLEKFTAFAAAKKNSKTQLECVHLEITNNMVRAVACDGYRITETRSKMESGGAMELLLPAASLRILSKLVEDKDVLYLGIKNHCAVFFCSNLYFSSRIANGPYLDVDSLLGTPGEYRAMIQSAKLKDALETVSAIADGYSSIEICFLKDRVSLTCDGPSGTKAFTELSAQVLNPMFSGAGYCYKATDLVQGICLLDGFLALSISKNGSIIVTNGTQKYMQPAKRPSKRPEKTKNEDNATSMSEKKTVAKKKNTKTEKTAAKAA